MSKSVRTRRKKRKPEGELVKNITVWPTSASTNHDKERIIQKGIESPDISQMPFRVKEGKTIRFFASKEKYERYMKQLVQ